MIKQDYINRLYEMGIASKKDINNVINELFKLMADDLKNGEKITISNFGTFEVSKSKPREVYSPYDGRLIKVESQKRVHFKSSSYIKDKNN